MAGYRVLEAANLDEAIRGLEQQSVDVVVAALDLPPDGSSALLAAMRRRPEWEAIPVLALADSAEQIQAPAVQQAHFQDCQVKFDREAMLESLARLASALASADARIGVRGRGEITMAIDTVTSKSELAQTSGQFSTFFVADLFFGVDVLRVQEVLRFQQMTRVPQAPQVIEGLINLRGQIVTAIDMRRRLRLPPRAGEQTPMNMVVRTDDGAVSLLVDEIGDVLDVDAATYERPPENLDPAARELIRGVYKLKDRLLLVLDAERTVDLAVGTVA
jgi:purine-binding chemotaxis protein CheW